MPLLTNINQAQQLRELNNSYPEQPEQPMQQPKTFGGDQAPFDQRRTMSGPNGQRMTPEEYAKMMAAARALRGR